MSTQESEAGYQVFLDDEVEVEEEYEEEEEYESIGSEPSQKRQKASDIWEGFTILKHGNNGCSACNRIIADSSKSSSSLWRSLDSLDKPQTGPDYDAARRSLVMLIITSGQSLSLVEGCGFQCFLHALNPQFRLCRSILERDVMDLYGREKDSLQFIMSEAPGRISFAVDHWKGKETGENYNDDIYICIAACFVDADWNLQRRIMGFKHSTFPDDIMSVVDTVASCFTAFKVDKKVMCITLDNALYDASVANSLKTILQDKGKLLCDGELYQVHCCTDILNSVVQAGLELIGDVVDHIRHGIHCITYSSEREDEFYQYAKEICHLDVTVKLRADLVVSWDSTYKMLGCALYY